MDLEHGQIVAEYVRPRKCRTGDQTPKPVLLVGPHEMEVDLLAEVLFCLPHANTELLISL